MKVIINEKQLSCIVKHRVTNKELDEEDDTSSPDSATTSAPSSSTSTSSTGSVTQGYPQVDHWESGMTRGHANPIGNTKWESGMTRGHANPLSEQMYPNPVISQKMSEDILNYLEEHPVILQVGASIAAGILTGGSTLWVQALSQLAIQLPFSINDYSKGDNIGATISLLIAALPVASRVIRLGSWANFSVLNKIIPELKTVKTSEDLARLIQSKSNLPEGVMLKRLISQTPAELEKVITTTLGQGMVKAVDNGVKIPFENQMWWKQLGVELPAAAGLSVGGAYVELNNNPLSGTLDMTQYMKSNKQYTDADIPDDYVTITK